MSYFLTQDNFKSNDTVTLTGDEFTHAVKSRRMKIHESINIQDPSGTRYQCEIKEITSKKLTAAKEQKLTPNTESPLDLTLFIAITSLATLEFIIQKATELGVTNIKLFPATNSPSRDLDSIMRKLARFERIAIEAAKQSDRLQTPSIEVSSLNSISDPDYEAIYLCHPDQANKLKPTKKLEKAALIIGPEGGLSNKEVNYLSRLKNLTTISLGNRILRSETACISAISILQHNFGDL